MVTFKVNDSDARTIQGAMIAQAERERSSGRKAVLTRLASYMLTVMAAGKEGKCR